MSPTKSLLTVVVTALILTGGLYWAHAQTAAPAESDPRLDKIIEQNTLILKQSSIAGSAAGPMCIMNRRRPIARWRWPRSR